MLKNRWVVVMILLIVAGLLLYTVTFTVGATEMVIVKTFGQASAPIQGATDGGLHFKWPYPAQKLVRYDGRVFVFDATHEEVSTADRQNILVTVFCGWRIKDADKFLRAVDNPFEAERRLSDLVRVAKSDVVGKHQLSDFLSTDPEKMRLAAVESEILASVSDSAEKAYGVQVVTLGIKALGLPKRVTEEVIKNMQSERQRYAEERKSSGESEAQRIKAVAQASHDQIMEFARLKAKSIEAEGQRAAGELSKAFQRNEQFAMFLIEMEDLRESLKENTVIICNSSLKHSFGYFQNPPTAENLPGKPQPASAPAAAGK